MRIGMIDVDGHNFPNLALMRISAYHKARGDTVEWWWSDFVHYDIVYMSKIFSGTYTEDVPEPLNADRVIKGGTGYCIHLGDNGKEHFDKSKNTELPPEIERCFPDYSIYPQFPFAVSMTSRGCPRGWGNLLCEHSIKAMRRERFTRFMPARARLLAPEKQIKLILPKIPKTPGGNGPKPPNAFKCRRRNTVENKEKLQKIQAALNKMILPEERDGGLSAELAGVVRKLAAISGHNAEVIAADLDGKSDVLKVLSEKAWDYARQHKKGNGYSMGEGVALKLAAEYFAVPVEAAADAEGTAPETEKAQAAPEKKIFRLEDLL